MTPDCETTVRGHSLVLINLQSMATIDEALSKFPNNRRLQSTRAVALNHDGDRPAAFAEFDTIYGDSAAHHNIAILDLEAGNEGAAHDAVVQAVAANPAAETLQLATALTISIQ